MSPENVIPILISFALGLVTGILIEIMRFRFLIRKDNWNELKPYLSEVYIALRDVKNSVQYLVHSDTFEDEITKRLLDNIVKELKRYNSWYRVLRSRALTQKLQSIDEELSAHLCRLYEFSRNVLSSENYLITRLGILLEIVDVVIEEINGFMRGEVLSCLLYTSDLPTTERV